MTYTPEVLVRLVLGDPVLVHVLEEIVTAKWFEEGPYAGAIVCRNHGTVRQTSCGIR